ncbi:hypothetical protein IJ579_08395 [bacterium]|nr:hypothetical protein [bacterium]
MGKKSKKYPEYSNGSVVVNGRTVATVTKDKDNNVISSNYNMSDAEKNIYNSIQSGLSNSLGNLFNISDAQRKEWNNQINSLRNQGINEINSIYEPMETNLKNDVARRFGNLDNSVFLDNLNSITDKRAKAVADLSDDLLSAQNDMYNQELQNRINTITLLSNLNSIMNNNILSYTSLANTNAGSGNNYNANSYSATSGNKTSFLSDLSPYFSTAASTAMHFI